MTVQKYGGTSVGSPERIKNVASLITKGNYKGNIVVVSAMSGTTNSLVEICQYLEAGNSFAAGEVVSNLRRKYICHLENLFPDEETRKKTAAFLDGIFDFLAETVKTRYTAETEGVILAQGEIMSSNMLTDYLLAQGVNVRLLDALAFMKKDRDGNPDFSFIEKNLKSLIASAPEADLYITQGFICRNADGALDNLDRGGSDYTASILGAVTKAEEIQIWTDIDGLHNNDPRIVENTACVPHLFFEEASELAYFGAKILHPTCVQPAKMCNIPVRLLNTMDPDAPGTLIDNHQDHGTIKAVAAKDNITAIQIHSGRMLQAYGFMLKVFEVFEKHKTAIDMICTSEVGVSMSIDDTSRLSMIEEDLRKYGTVTIDKNMCIICVVGDMDWENKGFETKVMDAMADIPVRMVSYGGSNFNISFLIRQEDKERALKALNMMLFHQ